MISIFITYIYQPFFNILVGIYWLLGQITDGRPDMGVAVIIFSVLVRFLMLPLTLSADRSEKEKRHISEQINKLNKELKDQPDQLKKEKRKILKANPGALVSEGITLLVQIIIVLMLYRIFKTGLAGRDLHLLYPFMPSVKTPINLMFLNQYDLSLPSFVLNLIQSILILGFESLHMLFSSVKFSRKEFTSLAVFLPIISFIVFSMLPAGKKLFIITSLVFSILLLLIKQALFLYHSFLGKSPSNQESNEPEKGNQEENNQKEDHQETNNQEPTLQEKEAPASI